MTNMAKQPKRSCKHPYQHVIYVGRRDEAMKEVEHTFWCPLCGALGVCRASRFGLRKWRHPKLLEG